MSGPRQMTNASLAKSIKRHRDAIAKHRDALRELVVDAVSVETSCTDAIDSLDYAVDILSTSL